MRHGVRIGVDFGTVRIGIARSDPEGRLATPVAAITAGVDAAAEVAALVTAAEAIEVVVGHPIGLSGEPGRAADAAAVFAGALVPLLPGVRVALLDERLTTAEAGRRLREAGRDTRQSRDAVDSASAVVILHHALEVESTSGRPPGTTVRGRGRMKRREAT